MTSCLDWVQSAWATEFFSFFSPVVNVLLLREYILLNCVMIF